MRSEQHSGGQHAAPPFEIRERTFQFAVCAVNLVRQFPHSVDAVEIGRQLLRAATSVGANVEEARETRYWLRLAEATIMTGEGARSLLQESDELVRILSSIITKARRKLDQ